MQTAEQHLLGDLEVQLQQASSGKRLANYLIDLIVFYLLLFCFGVVIAAISPSTADELANSNPLNSLVDRLLTMIFYGIYMCLTEGIFKGRSLGKLITGTRAVNEDGSPVSFQTALYRGLSRAVPFDAFSALGSPSYPWHDKWTHTYVIDEKLSML